MSAVAKRLASPGCLNLASVAIICAAMLSPARADVPSPAAAKASGATVCPDQRADVADPEEAIAFCTHVIDGKPQDSKQLANALVSRGKAQYVQQNYDAALSDANAAIQADPSDAAAKARRRNSAAHIAPC